VRCRSSGEQMWTEADDKEIAYGKWHRYTAKTTRAEQNKVNPPEGEIWPHWSEGVPTKLRTRVYTPTFFVNSVCHYPVHVLTTLELQWSDVYT
jgi:hypothetical protein